MAWDFSRAFFYKITQMTQDNKIWIKISLFFLMTTALLGFIIRLIPLQSFIPSSYFYGILQSHSHTGFLGWVFMILYYLLLKIFGKNSIYLNRKSNIILSLLAFFILGMTISFPTTGYGIFSITFLSLFLIFSYYALFYLYKNIDSTLKNTISYKFLLSAILFYLLSSISPWLLGPIIAKGFKKTALYYNDIFFYLHFLYNGFVTFSIIALFFTKIELKNLKNKIFRNNFKNALILFVVGTLLNYSESLLWNKPNIIIYIIAFISSILLLTGLYYLSKIYEVSYSNLNKNSKYLAKLALSMFFLKTLLQLFQSFPIFSELSYVLKSQFIIGYIHLVTLGFITSSIIVYLIKAKLLEVNKLFNLGIVLFIIGFVLTEVLLFLQGVLLWSNITFLTSNFALLMLISSTFLFFGFLALFLASLQKKNRPTGVGLF